MTLHRINTLKSLKEEQDKLAAYSTGSTLLNTAIQLAEEQQELISKLSKRVSNLRKQVIHQARYIKVAKDKIDEEIKMRKIYEEMSLNKSKKLSDIEHNISSLFETIATGIIDQPRHEWKMFRRLVLKREEKKDDDKTD